MGDAGEMLVAAELTLQGIPSFIVPSNWPSYDIVAQPPGGELQRISVKTRTFAKSGNFVGYNDDDQFDWLAIVILSLMKQFVGTLGQWGLWSTGACQRKFHFLSRPKEAGSHRDCQPLRPATCPRISVSP